MVRHSVGARGLPSNKDKVIPTTADAKGVLPRRRSLRSITLRIARPPLEGLDQLGKATALVSNMEIDPVPATFGPETTIPGTPAISKRDQHPYLLIP